MGKGEGVCKSVVLSVERSQLPVGQRGSFLMPGQADTEVEPQSPGGLHHRSHKSHRSHSLAGATPTCSTTPDPC
ncbi:hypothetical protein JOQ06_014801 [Pogonophryne albipinna]|uniref:Uncharacterized protein n=1 Tax=Pogonophryne albipinna TaxID=1090488 RepID=A0AAD6ALJ8_9TELE|nr:hypothetical protein JOQ06_014801 [Pogonophryne albipinna]